MLKTKDKICQIIILMALLICSLFAFVGCKTADLYCYFVSEDEIVLMTNSNLSTRELKIESNTQYNVFWDANIIDYNSETGEIVAKKEGKTKFVVSFVKDNKTYSQSVSVTVIEPAFATDIELESQYIFFIGTRNNKFSCNVTTQNNKPYNFDLQCVSSDWNCFQTNKDVIIPQTTGTATLTVRAVKDYDEEKKEFSYIEEHTKVVIERPVEDLTLALCDGSGTEFAKKESYPLFSGNDNNLPNYYLKLRSSQNIASYKIAKANANQLWDIDQNRQIIVKNSNEVYVPIKVYGNGKSDISVKLERQNSEVVFVSNSLNIYCYKYLNQEDVKLYVAKQHTTKETLVDNANSLIEFVPNSQTGNYELYKIAEDSNYFPLAIQNKKYFYGIICFDNLDTNCYNEINAEASNLTLEKVALNKFYFKVEQSGNARVLLTATAIDGRTFQKILTFDVTNVFPDTFSCVEDVNITMQINEEKDFAISNVVPVYANTNYQISLQNNNGVLELNGTKVCAKSAGQEVVNICVGDRQYAYYITVESDISCEVSEQMYTNGEYCVVISVNGTYDSIKDVCVLEDENANIIIMQNYIRISSNKIISTIYVTICAGEDFVKTIEVDWGNT